MNNTLFPLFCYQRMLHKSCIQFSFVQIIRQNCGEQWFWVSLTLHYHPTSSIAVFLQHCCHPSDVSARFCCFQPSTHSASSIDSSSVTNWLCYWNTVTRDTDESPNAFTNIYHVFAAVNPTLQQNCIMARCSKFFSMVIYNTSTEHRILQNAHILSHIDGMTSNLVCK